MAISDKQAGGIGAIKGLSEWWSENLWKYSLQKQNKTRKYINIFYKYTYLYIYVNKYIKTIISVPGH